LFFIKYTSPSIVRHLVLIKYTSPSIAPSIVLFFIKYTSPSIRHLVLSCFSSSIRHLVLWDYSANSAYHNDIAGLGRDNVSGLHQKISKSNSTDAVVTMSTEAIGSTNAGISTTLTNDSYLLWGNNNATTSAHDDLPAGYTGRLYKEWVVEMTGTVADVHVEIDISSEKLGGDAAADFYLLIDADGDFTSGASATVANTFSSNKVTFNDIDFTDGQYFTLATIQPGPGEEERDSCPPNPCPPNPLELLMVDDPRVQFQLMYLQLMDHLCKN
jgi:hypothetical protein